MQTIQFIYQVLVAEKIKKIVNHKIQCTSFITFFDKLLIQLSINNQKIIFEKLFILSTICQNASFSFLSKLVIICYFKLYIIVRC